MNTKTELVKENLSQDEIDRIVVAEADDDSAWEEPIYVSRTKTLSLPISAELVARAGFFAHLHGEVDAETWLTRIIRERLELELAAYGAAKRELAAKRA